VLHELKPEGNEQASLIQALAQRIAKSVIVSSGKPEFNDVAVAIVVQAVLHPGRDFKPAAALMMGDLLADGKSQFAVNDTTAEFTRVAAGLDAGACIIAAEHDVAAMGAQVHHVKAVVTFRVRAEPALK